MHKRSNGIISSILAITLLTGCSGVTHGFDEESALYTKPSSEKELNKEAKTPMRPEQESKEVDEVPKAEAQEQESETTITYDPYEGE